MRKMLPYFEVKHMLSGIIVCCGCRRAQNASGGCYLYFYVQETENECKQNFNSLPSYLQ